MHQQNTSAATAVGIEYCDLSCASPHSLMPACFKGRSFSDVSNCENSSVFGEQRKEKIQLQSPARCNDSVV